MNNQITTDYISTLEPKAKLSDWMRIEVRPMDNYYLESETEATEEETLP